jgi:hypothetical protein
MAVITRPIDLAVRCKLFRELLVWEAESRAPFGGVLFAPWYGENGGELFLLSV